VRAESVDALRQHIDDLEKRASVESLAWRGHARPEWKLEPTLDRALQKVAPEQSYEQWLGREQAVVARFKSEAGAYASETETRYLQDIWSTLAFGRHAGLPTRLLDWTWSSWVAVWFACHEHSDADGVIWWFDQSALEEVIHAQWGNWGVPTRAQHQGFANLSEVERQRLGLDQRALEATAFKRDGHAWISKLHYRFPCSRMQAQQGFPTVCGRLRKTHNEAIDELPDSNSIPRGRILIAAGIKGKVLEFLRTMNIHARSLEYPGVDIVARGISP
jgi:hypothetical protein